MMILPLPAAIVVSTFVLSVLSISGSTSVLAAPAKTGVSSYHELHADDPVQWRKWNTATLELAKSSGKLILLSVGYSSCHYCHVMQRESFRDPQIAAYLNRNFIPVLVDRELNPVLDKQLLKFMEVMGAPQGWPMNIVVIPEGYPLAGNVYQPPDQFFTFLKRVQAQWKSDKRKWTQVATSAARHVVSNSQLPRVEVGINQVDHFHQILVSQSKLVSDNEFGGFGSGAKYPMSPQLLALLRIQKKYPDQGLAHHLKYTLQQMASQGLRDPLDGGFFRYTVDRQWRSPHYERMLYDSAQLALVYLEAATVLKEPGFRVVGIRALDFISTILASNEGGYVASLSADDANGVNGGYYLWSASALKKLLSPKEYQVVTRAWSRIENPKRSATVAQFLPVGRYDPQTIGRELSMDAGEVRRLAESARSKVGYARAKRSIMRDEKQLAGWNGLTLTAFSRAARETGDTRYRKHADVLYSVIIQRLWDRRRLRRTPGGEPAILADYAYVAAGMYEYARLTGSKKHYQECREIVEQGWQRFYVENTWLPSEHSVLPYAVHPVTIPDSELPSPSSTLISVTLSLGERMKLKYQQQARYALLSADGKMLQAPFFYATQIATLILNHESLKTH